MINTVYNIFLLQFLDGFLDQCLVAVLDQPHELLSPERPEVPLELAEHVLDRIVLGAVRHVVDKPEPVLSHGCLRSI